MLNRALAKKGEAPLQVMLPQDDPAELFFRQAAKKLQVGFESVLAESIVEISSSLKKSFGQHFTSPSTWDAENSGDDDAKSMIPDSYHLCPCGSGEKYKYCCKRIFREVTAAMCAAEEGNFREALEWIAKAKVRVGNTAEVLGRESIVYSFFDSKKSEELLKQCLAVNSKYPRAYYPMGLTMKERGDYKEAIIAYNKAIKYYPITDHYHLNEVTRRNLNELIYKKGL